MKKPIVIGCLSTVALAMAAGAAAHHSYAMFDSTKQVSLVGKIREFRWTNPHSWIQIDVPNEQGGTDTWSVECGSPNDMARHGWRASTLKPGDQATIVIHPLRNGDKGGRFISVTLADGTVLSEPALRKPPPTKQ